MLLIIHILNYMHLKQHDMMLIILCDRVIILQLFLSHLLIKLMCFSILLIMRCLNLIQCEILIRMLLILKKELQSELKLMLLIQLRRLVKQLLRL